MPADDEHGVQDGGHPWCDRDDGIFEHYERRQTCAYTEKDGCYGIRRVGIRRVGIIRGEITRVGITGVPQRLELWTVYNHEDTSKDFQSYKDNVACFAQSRRNTPHAE